MSEDLSSNMVKDLGLGISLLERLFFHYETDSKYKLKLMKNFRSYREIADLASHLFYDDALESWLEKPGKIILVKSSVPYDLTNRCLLVSCKFSHNPIEYRSFQKSLNE